MSLATRCTSCGTVFRVVQDQLKVSDGWVRCGRCDAVFNAAEGLFDLEREAPPAWSPTQPPVAATRTEVETDPVDAPGATNAPHEGHRQGGARDEPPATGGNPAPVAAPPAPSQDLLSAALARPVDDFDGVAAEPPAAAATAAAAPGFVAQARRDAFWQRGRTRAVLWSAAALLLVLLAGQAAGQFSDIAAARWPAVRPVLARWCASAGCSLAAPRQIEDIVVDNSTLAPVIGTEALKLGIALRNRASFAVAVPSVELSLTDSAGRLIARRILAPGDFRIAAASLAPGSESSLQAHITAGTERVTGYTVEIFYP